MRRVENDSLLTPMTLPLEANGTRRRARWIIATSSEQSWEFLLPAVGSVVVGRSRKSDLVVPDESVSRQHLRIHVDAGLRVEDLGSANGTFIGGRRLSSGEIFTVDPNVALRMGDVVLVQVNVERALPFEIKEARSISASVPILVNEKMKNLYAIVDRIAKTKIAVIVLGETGVGKEHVAAALHGRSLRRHGPFISINCGALPETLAESELFGFEASAFSGANRAKPGLIEAAHDGTLFLDEVAELSMEIQAKLLRVLESGELTRLGSIKTKRIDVRIVAATNVDLDTAVGLGKFRLDLLYRLRGATLRVPPLRERVDEIWPLTLHFLRSAALENKRSVPVVSESLKKWLEGQRWPGNVRELKSAVERCLALSVGDLLNVSDVESNQCLESIAQVCDTGEPRSKNEFRPSERERELISEALRLSSGNQTRAAQTLGMARRTLVKKLGQYGFSRPRER